MRRLLFNHNTIISSGFIRPQPQRRQSRRDLRMVTAKNIVVITDNREYLLLLI